MSQPGGLYCWVMGNDELEPQNLSNPSGNPSGNVLSLTATAYHEAGHAVVATSLGRSIQKVTVANRQMPLGGVRLGACQIKKGRTKSSKEPLEDDVLILFAGMVAESKFTGKYCRGGASEDLLAINRLLQTRARSERELQKLQRRLLDRTEHLLAEESHTKAIEMIAKELLEKTTISGRAVRHFFDQAVRSASR